MPSLRIDVVSDVVCPWCLIGTRRLELALAELPELEATVTYRPFMLEPGAPAEGRDLREHLRRKYGDPEPMFQRVEAVAREVGLPLDFGKVRRMVPTLRAHALSARAVEKGTQRALMSDLFEAYFLEGRDVSAMDVLLELGERHGFSRDEVIALVEDPAALAATRDEALATARAGVTGVPLVILGGKVSVSGAQPVATFKAAIAKALAVA
jgi:predicted DsbA family dithiol-disulfide isomerase